MFFPIQLNGQFKKTTWATRKEKSMPTPVIFIANTGKEKSQAPNLAKPSVEYP